MEKLKIFENELVPVYETSTGEKVVYGTNLHSVLGVKSKFADWVKNRLKECDSIENEDFQAFSKNLENGGRSKEYIINLDTAKEMAMLERNEKGKQVRRYFIEVEKKWKNQISNPRRLSVAEQIRLLALGNGELGERIDNVEKELQDFKNDMPLLGVEETRITTAVRSKGVRVLGGKDSNAYADKSLRRRVFSDIYRELKRQFQVGTYKAIKRSQCEVALEIINDYEPPLALEEEIRDCNAQESFVPSIA